MSVSEGANKIAALASPCEQRVAGLASLQADNSVWARINENYAVSNGGIVIRTTKGRQFDAGYVLTPRLDHGYLTVTLSSKNKCKGFRVHRLVALFHVPNPDNKPEVNHIDGNKQNPAASNLEWVTSSENKLHAYRLRLIPGLIGVCAKYKRLTPEQRAVTRKHRRKYPKLGEMNENR